MFNWYAEWGRIEQEEVIKGGQKRPFLGPTHSKFEYVQHALSGRVMFDKLAKDLELLFYFKVVCAKVPNFSYEGNLELKVLAHEMVVADFPNPEHWREFQQYGLTKYKLQP